MAESKGISSKITLVDNASAALDAITLSAVNAGKALTNVLGATGAIGQKNFDFGVSSIGSLGKSFSNVNTFLNDMSSNAMKSNQISGNAFSTMDSATSEIGDTVKGFGERLVGFLGHGANIWGSLKTVSAAVSSISGSLREIDRGAIQLSQLEKVARSEGLSGQQAKDRAVQMRGITSNVALDLGVNSKSYIDAVTSFADNKAFNSFEEAAKFSELLNKQLMANGASANDAATAINHLTRGFTKGKIAGGGLLTILNQSSEIGEMIERSFARINNIPFEQVKGKVYELAQEGKLTSDIVKNALINASDEINANFENVPMTFERAFENIKTNALIALQPAIDKLAEFAASEDFSSLMTSVTSALQSIASIAVFALDALSPIISAVSHIVGLLSEVVKLFGPIATGLGAVAAGWWGLTTAATAFRTILMAITAHPVIAVLTAAAAGGMLAFNALSKAFGKTKPSASEDALKADNALANQMRERQLKESEQQSKIMQSQQDILSGISSKIDKIPGLGADFEKGIDKFMSEWAGKTAVAALREANPNFDQMPRFAQYQAYQDELSKARYQDLDIMTSDTANTARKRVNEIDKELSNLGLSAYAGLDKVRSDFARGNVENISTTLRGLLEQEASLVRERGGIADNITEYQRRSMEYLLGIEVFGKETAKNTRSMRIDRDSILFMKQMAVADVINRYNYAAANVTNNWSVNSIPTSRNVKELNASSVSGAMAGMRVGQ
jgi:tape measure domain-containing protein